MFSDSGQLNLKEWWGRLENNSEFREGGGGCGNNNSELRGRGGHGYSKFGVGGISFEIEE